jgi:hypothetical protein
MNIDLLGDESYASYSTISTSNSIISDIMLFIV